MKRITLRSKKKKKKLQIVKITQLRIFSHRMLFFFSSRNIPRES